LALVAELEHSRVSRDVGGLCCAGRFSFVKNPPETGTYKIEEIIKLPEMTFRVLGTQDSGRIVE
jgi:hypothetical protein